MKAAFSLLRIVLITALSSAFAADLVGFRSTPKDPALADRTIYIEKNTNWVSIETRTIVAFEIGGTKLAWKFQGMHYVVDLRQIAPQGVLDRRVMVYVGPRHDPWRGYWSGH